MTTFKSLRAIRTTFLKSSFVSVRKYVLNLLKKCEQLIHTLFRSVNYLVWFVLCIYRSLILLWESYFAKMMVEDCESIGDSPRLQDSEIRVRKDVEYCIQRTKLPGGPLSRNN